MMKRKGRFVIEAAVLVPGICIMLVYLVYFTLYAHDYAVCRHAALESGTKGIYRETDTVSEVKEAIQADLEEKLSERLLWMKDPQVSVSVTPLQASITISGAGAFLTYSIDVSQSLYRIHPCETIRSTKWLRATGESS